MRVPGSFTLTHRSVFMQTHFVGGWKCIIAICQRSETVSKFSHRAPAPPSSCTPALAPPSPSPRPSPKRPAVSGHHNLSCVPTELQLPCAARTPAGTPRPLSRAPRGVGTPAPPGHLLRPAPGPGAGPLPREPAGGQTAAAVLWGVRTAPAEHGLPPAGHHIHRHTHVTHTQNTRLAPVRYHRRGANSHPGGSGLRSPRRD